MNRVDGISPTPSRHAIPLADQLKHVGQQYPDTPALGQTRHGAWVVWRWADVREEVSRLAEGLQRLGFQPGNAAAVSGEIGPELLLIALAVYSVGGRLVAVPPHATRQQIAQVLTTATVTLAFTTSRNLLSRWLTFTEHDHPELRIVFDYSTVGDRVSRQRAVAYRELRGETTVRHTPPRSRFPSILWVEEHTTSTAALNAILHTWLDARHVLAAPELLGTAARDRQAVYPQQWLATIERAEWAAAGIAARFAPAGTVRRAVTDWALTRRRHPTARLLRALVRHRLGLSRLQQLVLMDAGHDIRQSAALGLFSDLGVGIAAHDPAASSSVAPTPLRTWRTQRAA